MCTSRYRIRGRKKAPSTFAPLPLLLRLSGGVWSRSFSYSPFLPPSENDFPSTSLAFQKEGEVLTHSVFSMSDDIFFGSKKERWKRTWKCLRVSSYPERRKKKRYPTHYLCRRRLRHPSPLVDGTVPPPPNSQSHSKGAPLLFPLLLCHTEPNVQWDQEKKTVIPSSQSVLKKRASVLHSPLKKRPKKHLFTTQADFFIHPSFPSFGSDSNPRSATPLKGATTTRVLRYYYYENEMDKREREETRIRFLVGTHTPSFPPSSSFAL